MDVNDLIKLSEEATQASYNTINDLHEQVKGYKEVLDYSSKGTQGLVSALDRQSRDRTSRIRLSIVVGAIAIILGVLALWNSSSIGVGFHQTFLIAAGGALITFCLVELILDKIIEIPSREAKKHRELVDIYRSHNQKVADLTQNLLEGTKETDARLDELLPRMKKVAFPNEP